MATNFPTSLDALSNPTSGSTLASPSHSGQHADANDAIEAIQAKVGVNGSAVTTSLDYKVTNGIHSALNVDSGVLFVDATNNRVGVNTTSPAYALDVTGTADATVFLQNATDYLSPFNGFRNAIINGDFRINQRGWSSSTITGTYGFDRWKQVNSGGTVTMSSQSFTVGSPAATGYEAEKFCRLVSASQSGTGDYALLVQQIEDVRSFSNATITVSFWAKASSGTPKVALEMQQVFGSGGSADVNTYGGQATLSTSWARYSLTVTVPSVSGKTIGTSSNLGVQFWVSGGSTFNSRTGSLGIQNNTFDFWGVQVERGSYATPFEQRPIGTELALCQRYYEKSYKLTTAPGTAEYPGFWQFYGSNDIFGGQVGTIVFAVPKRYASYTMTGYNPASANTTTWNYGYNGGLNTGTNTPTFDNGSEKNIRVSTTISGAGGGVTSMMNGHWVCNAEF